MYTREDKLRAVELFVKLDFSPQSVINELGYPSRGSLYNWYREYMANGNDIPDAKGMRTFFRASRQLARDSFCTASGSSSPATP